MLKRMFALSDQGSRDLNKGIAATTLSNLCLIAPVSLLVMVIWELLNVISGQESSMRDHAALFICGTVVMFIKTTCGTALHGWRSGVFRNAVPVRKMKVLKKLKKILE